MKEVNKHIIYTADDIHQYLTGKLSGEEMHAIEKAALTDPLLAEAIEGFHETASFKNEKEFGQLQKELDQLKKRIANTKHTGFYNWWKMAAVLVFFIGCFITYRAITPTSDQTKGTIASTVKPILKPVIIDTSSQSATTKDIAKNGYPDRDHIMPYTPPIIKHIIADSPIAIASLEKTKILSGKPLPIENSFAGVVNDEEGKSIPYAMLILDSTYQSRTDQQGFFDMKATRSFMKLEVKADGYYSKTIDVQPGDYKAITLYKILLKKDTAGDSRLRSLVTILYKNGAEPTDGWEKYLQYMVDQLSNSEYDDGRPVKGEMILTFKIDYNSVPTDFYFEESIDDDVDNAVKKLIEGGPNWKNTNGNAVPGTIRMRIIF